MALPMSLHGYRKEVSSSKYKNNCLAPHSPNFLRKPGQLANSLETSHCLGQAVAVALSSPERNRYVQFHEKYGLPDHREPSGKLADPQRSCGRGEILG